MHDGENVPSEDTGPVAAPAGPPGPPVPPAPAPEAAAPPVPAAPAPEAAAPPPPPRAAPVLPVLAAQRRARRMRFLAGLALIIIPGALWAGLTKDPVRQQNFDQVLQNDAVFVGGPPMMAEPMMPFISEEVEIASGEEVTLTKRLDVDNEMTLTLEEGDRLEVRFANADSDFPPGYRSIIDLSVTGPDGTNTTSASLVFPAADDTVAIEHTADTGGEHTIELTGDFSPFSVDLTIARNPESAADDSADESTDGDG